MKRIPVAIQIWLLSFAACVAAIALAFAYVDVPVARTMSYYFPRFDVLGESFGSAIILSVETLVVMALVLARLIRGHIPPWAEALAVACLTSICAYAINSGVLKLVFGVPNPTDVMKGAEHAFHLGRGSWFSGFPSGHMALAGGFAGVFMRLYPRTIWLLSALLVVGVVLLIGGHWHFISDVIAGTFLGLSAGILAGELWEAHLARWSAPGAFRL